jgi:uncharacterized protein YndB with AHSA1/START domain
MSKMAKMAKKAKAAIMSGMAELGTGEPNGGIIEMAGGASTRSSIVVSAPRERVYAAFMNPDELLAWLPPAEMTGVFHQFDARVGGGYQMSLFYAPDEQSFQGKTAELEDRVVVRFVELSPPERIVEVVTFVSDDPSFAGEMTLTVSLSELPDGTEVTLLFENLPPGLRPEDNKAGADLSLGQLDRYLGSSS